MNNLQNELIEKFKLHIQQLGYSDTTVNMLPYCVKLFLEYNNIQTAKQAGREHIKAFYEYLQQKPQKNKNQPLSEQYINHNIYSLKVFFNWLETTGQIKQNPISNIKFKKPKVNIREPLHQDEIKELFAATINAKEIAILHLFYSCGLRRTEAENINTSDIHFTQNLLYVREGKGSKRRVVPITHKVKKELENYFEKERKMKAAKDTEAFILNATNGRMSGDGYNKILKQIVQRTELNKERTQITLHHLRHSIATHLLENGLTIEYVRDFLGHSFLESTQVYTKIYKQQLQKL